MSVLVPAPPLGKFSDPLEDIGIGIGKHYAESWKVGWIGQVLAHSDISGITYLASNIGLSVYSFFREPYKGAKEQVWKGGEGGEGRGRGRRRKEEGGGRKKEGGKREGADFFL
jgi:hypothetical protein